MNERDELAEILYVEDNWTSTISEHDSNRLADEVYRERASKRWRAGKAGWAYHRKYPERADAILAAGYRKPRTISTAEELDALPNWSVIVDREGDAWQRYTTGWTCTDRAMNTVDQPSVNLTNILGPATVLWEPR